MAEPLSRVVAEGLAARHDGAIVKQHIKVPVEVDNVPDYACNACKAGDHDKCTPRVVYIGWEHECQCSNSTPHTRYGDVLVIPLAIGDTDG